MIPERLCWPVAWAIHIRARVRLMIMNMVAEARLAFNLDWV